MEFLQLLASLLLHAYCVPALAGVLTVKGILAVCRSLAGSCVQLLDSCYCAGASAFGLFNFLMVLFVLAT
jgi:hypothetical protein